MTAREAASVLGKYWQQALDAVRHRTPQIRETLATHRQQFRERLAPTRRTVIWAVGIIIAALLLIGFLSGQIQAFWEWYSRPPGVSTTVGIQTTTGATTITNSQTTNAKSNADVVNPLGAAVGAAVLAWIALRQMGIPRKQAETADKRHTAQTDADRQRRITESFSKAIDQLASDKLEVRLGGIYSLERISKESQDDYGEPDSICPRANAANGSRAAAADCAACLFSMEGRR
jgi:hypothetical protein